MLSWAVKSSHDKRSFSLHGTAVLASHFQPPLSSRSLCACKICFVGKIQRQGVSFAKINVIYNSNCVPYETRLRKQRKVISVNDGQTCRSIAEHPPFPYCKWTERPHSMKQSMPITAQHNGCILYLLHPLTAPRSQKCIVRLQQQNNNVLCCWMSKNQPWLRTCRNKTGQNLKQNLNYINVGKKIKVTGGPFISSTINCQITNH